MRLLSPQAILTCVVVSEIKRRIDASSLPVPEVVGTAIIGSSQRRYFADALLSCIANTLKMTVDFPRTIARTPRPTSTAWLNRRASYGFDVVGRGLVTPSNRQVSLPARLLQRHCQGPGVIIAHDSARCGHPASHPPGCRDASFPARRRCSARGWKVVTTAKPSVVHPLVSRHYAANASRNRQRTTDTDNHHSLRAATCSGIAARTGTRRCSRRGAAHWR